MEGVSDEIPDVDVHEQLEYLRSTTATDLLANHFFVLAQWSAVHLASSPPDLEGSRLVIDAMSAVLDSAGSRLGENLSLYRGALAEIQQVYVRASAQGAPSSGEDASRAEN